MKYQRILLFLAILAWFNHIEAEQSPLWKEYVNYKLKAASYSHYDIVSPCTTVAEEPQIGLLVNKLTYWNIQASQIKELLTSRPQTFGFQMQDPDGNPMTLMLVRQDIFGPDSRLLRSDGSVPVGLHSDGLFYRGVVAEFPGSLAALSFFPDEIAGVISLPHTGNLVFGKIEGRTQESNGSLTHVLYADKDLLQKPEFHCGALDEAPVAAIAPDTIYSNRCKTLKLFLECDYKLYQDKNRSVNNVKNYITGLFNVVKTLYYNEEINIDISDIMVWTTQDPFLHTDLASIIYQYSGYRQNNFTGNLAQLVTTYAPQQQGGIAFLGTLCQPYNGQSGPHSFAYIYNTYSQLPTYSWSVEVMTHELGHNLGSPHTHACFWGPTRNQALDNCQPPENNACANGPAPSNGGTIMSYCHLTGYGINFSNGFGQEPGDLIRNQVQLRSCVGSAFTPTVSANISGPYVEGDVIRLKARPSSSTYQYNWFHYDYLMPNAKDSSLTINYSGIYKAAISDRCTEYADPDTIQVSDFLVNLGCPLIPGKRDSAYVSFTMNADQGTTKDSLMVPDSIFKMVPAWGKDVLTELQITIQPQGTSWTRDVSMSYVGPAGTSIYNSKYNPNGSEPAQFAGVKSYKRILGRFDPKGVWQFTTNDSKFDNGIDARVRIAIVVSWRAEDSVASCDLALCEGDSRSFDAGIRNARYKWSTGDTTRTVTVRTPGDLSVEVTRGSRKSSHLVRLFHYPTHYQQQLSICKGDSLRIGSKQYKESGTYTDTLQSVYGCDSILTTELTLLEKPRTYEVRPLCFADTFNGFPFLKDSLLRFVYTAANGCDSIHEVQIRVNPPLSIQSFATPACPETGGTLDAIASGGSSSIYRYEWSNGLSGSHLEGQPSGTYTVVVTDSLGCKLASQVELKNLDAVRIAPLIFDVDCFGDTNGRIFLDFISGRAPFSVLWSNGATSKDILQIPAGIYTAFITDANGCKLVAPLELRSPELLLVQVDVTGSISNDGTAKASVSGGTSPYTFLWSTGDRSQNISGLAPGTYKVWIDDSKGCKASTEFYIQQLTNVHNPSEGGLRIFPNPVDEVLQLNLNTPHNEKNWSAHVLTMDGRHLLQWPLLAGSNQIPVYDWSQGMYLIEIRSEGIIVERYRILKSNK